MRIINGVSDALSASIIEDTAAAVDKYSQNEDYSDFDYDTALEPSAAIHGEMFNRLTYSDCTTDEDIAMRAYTAETHALLPLPYASGFRFAALFF